MKIFKSFLFELISDTLKEVLSESNRTYISKPNAKCKEAFAQVSRRAILKVKLQKVFRIGPARDLACQNCSNQPALRQDLRIKDGMGSIAGKTLKAFEGVLDDKQIKRARMRYLPRAGCGEWATIKLEKYNYSQPVGSSATGPRPSYRIVLVSEPPEFFKINDRGYLNEDPWTNALGETDPCAINPEWPQCRKDKRSVRKHRKSPKARALRTLKRRKKSRKIPKRQRVAEPPKKKWFKLQRGD